MVYEKLTRDNFNEFSLDSFIRHQEVKQSVRKIEGKYVLVENVFTEEWDRDTLRNVANEIVRAAEGGFIVFGAFNDKDVVGFIQLDGKLFGSKGQYAELKMLQVSEPFRRMGIGRRLLGLANDEAKAHGIHKLYISAHSSRESQAFYRNVGCVDAEEINRGIAENEPYDIQMEYVVN